MSPFFFIKSSPIFFYSFTFIIVPKFKNSFLSIGALKIEGKDKTWAPILGRISTRHGGRWAAKTSDRRGLLEDPEQPAWSRDAIYPPPKLAIAQVELSDLLGPGDP